MPYWPTVQSLPVIASRLASSARLGRNRPTARSIRVSPAIAIRRICASGMATPSPWRMRSDATRRVCARPAEGPAKAYSSRPSTVQPPSATMMTGSMSIVA